MKKYICVILFGVVAVCLNGCSDSHEYLQTKLDNREADRATKEQYSTEAKGTNVWWNSRYDTRTQDRHLNDDQFGFNR
jgi:hypothetical protein